jgi:hypothetical protein
MPTTQNIHKGIAVISASLFLCTSFSASAQVSTIHYNGNVLEVKNMADTTEILDPVTMETEWVVHNPSPIPLKLNNMNIYADNEVEQRPSVSGDKIRRYIIQQLSSHFKKDGEYRLMLDNIIIGDKGKIVYYNFTGVEEKITKRTLQANNKKTTYSNYSMGSTDWKETDKNLSITLSAQIEKIIDKTPAYQPAKVYNQPVPCLLDSKELQRPFYVKGGVIQY